MGRRPRGPREGAAVRLKAPTSSRLDLVALAAEVEGRVSNGLGVHLVAEERHEGVLRGAPIEMEARTFRSEASWGRSVVLRGKELAVANVVWASEPARGAPVLGVDLVALGAATGILVAADLSPTLPATTAEHASQLEAAARVRAVGAALPCAGPVLAPYTDLFTPHHVHVRVPWEDAECALLVRAVLVGLAELFVGFASAPPSPAHAGPAAEGFRRNMELHRQDARVSSVLSRGFGDEVAERIVRDLMFPSSIPEMPRA